MSRRLLAGLVTLAVLVGLLVAADRGAQALAERAVARQIAADQHLAQPPSVNLSGFPFLTQVVRGRYDGGRVVLHGLTTPALTIDTLDIRLHGVHLPLSEAISGSVQQVRVDKVEGTALLSYAQLTHVLGVEGLRLSNHTGRLQVSVPLHLPQIGTVPLSGSAAVSVDHGQLVIKDVRLAAGNSAVPQQLLSAVIDPVVSQLARGVPLGALPYGLRITGVHVTDQGLAVAVAGENVLLHR